MSARLTGSLDEAEQVVVKVEESRSVEAAAKKLRPEIEVAGAVRWVRRRLQGVRDSLLILLTLLPDRLGTKARLVEVRSILASERALVALREIGAPHLHVLPRPLGFRPPESERRKVRIDSNTKRGQIRRSTLR